MLTKLATRALTVCVLCMIAAACDGVGTGEHGNSGTDEMFFKKKAKATRNVIDDSVAAELLQSDQFPEDTGVAGAVSMSCQKVLAEGSPPTTRFLPQTIGEIYESGYLVSNFPGHAPVVFQNTEEMSFDVWKLTSDTDWSIDRKIQGPVLHPEQDSWVGYFVLDAGCLLPGMVLLAVRHDDPTAEFSLYIYDIAGESFSHVADISPEFRDPHRYFWIRHLDSEKALVLFYSQQTRESAEIYHNYYNHIMLFERGNPEGRELLTLGIDTGNVEDWTVDNNKMYLRTVDHRGHSEPRRSQWSLDLSNVLDK